MFLLLTRGRRSFVLEAVNVEFAADWCYKQLFVLRIEEVEAAIRPIILLDRSRDFIELVDAVHEIYADFDSDRICANTDRRLTTSSAATHVRRLWMPVTIAVSAKASAKPKGRELRRQR